MCVYIYMCVCVLACVCVCDSMGKGKPAGGKSTWVRLLPRETLTNRGEAFRDARRCICRVLLNDISCVLVIVNVSNRMSFLCAVPGKSHNIDIE